MNEFKEFLKLYRTNIKFKTRVSLNFSLILNLTFAVFCILFGIIANTNWYFVLSLYYTVLAVMRFALAKYIYKNPIGKSVISEWKRARLCAYIQTLLNLALSGAVLMIMYQDKGFEYSGYLIYAMAAYTFYITTVAIIDLIKQRKYNRPVVLANKMIDLASALLSMLALETAMLSAFGGEMLVETKRLFIALTGAGISLILLFMSSYMIIRSHKETDGLKKEKFNERKKHI